jgi:hypothetical protein
MRFLDKIGRVKLLTVALVLAATILAILVLLGLDGEPQVDGHTVTEWALQYSGYAKVRNVTQDQAAGEVRKCGKSGALFLARWLESQEPAWKAKLILWTQKLHWFPFHLLTAEQKRITGLFGLSVLRTNIGPVMERLAAYNPGTNLIERNAFNQIASGFTEHPQFFGSEDHILKLCSSSGPQYFVSCDHPGWSIPGASYLDLALLNTNAVRLDWISMSRSTRSGSMVLTNISGSSLNSLVALVLAKSGMWGQSPIEIRSSRTNFTIFFPAAETNEARALYIGINRDHFIFGNRVEEVR